MFAMSTRMGHGLNNMCMLEACTAWSLNWINDYKVQFFLKHGGLVQPPFAWIPYIINIDDINNIRYNQIRYTNLRLYQILSAL